MMTRKIASKSRNRRPPPSPDLGRMPTIKPVLHNGPLFVFVLGAEPPNKIWACACFQSGSDK